MAFVDPEPGESLARIGKRVSGQFVRVNGLLDASGDYAIPFGHERERFHLLGDSNIATLFEATQEGESDGSTMESDSEDESEEDFSSYQTEPLAKAYLKNITSIVDRLYHLSFKVRNPAMRIGLSKALKYVEVDEETQVNLIDVYASFDVSHVAELFHSFDHQTLERLHGDYLVQRLARANTRRRQQFRYWCNRKFKYERHCEAEGTLGTAQNMERQLGAGPLMAEGPQYTPTQPSTATWLDVDKINLTDDTSIISTRTVLRVANEKGGDHVSVPAIPAIDPNAKEFECPYCLMICPFKTLGKDAWETHIFRDLRPYVCTFEDCKEPDQQYDTLEDWISHEATQHGAIADSQACFQEYTWDCPVCLISKASPVHIACHLRRIACFSLPRPSDTSDDTTIDSGLSAKAETVTISSERSSNETLHKEAWPDTAPPVQDNGNIDKIESAVEQRSSQTQQFNAERIMEETGGEPTQPSPEKHSETQSYHTAPEERLGSILGGRLKLLKVLHYRHSVVIYSGVDIHTDVEYVVKALEKIGIDSQQLQRRQQEVRLHHLASQHPNVISLLHIVDLDDCLYLVMELCPEGDLFSSITEKGNFVGNDLLAKRAFLQILDAVQFCHSVGVYHCFLRPENVLVADQGLTVKLCDFSYATTDKRLFGDIWSLGILLINLTCGRNPWRTTLLEDPTFKVYLKDPFSLKTILPLTDEIICVLSRIFELNPTKRITIPELRKLIEECPSFTHAVKGAGS
ncbi:kinase-like protein [Aspergillus ellipticus CBS 707.79]|uniref:Kinase-like protein n=1 Tax=Aspergillus ellipticus CBS 707.79 TaxID=1448320 RepID=A0A319CXG4_9EURO|nr:kinase-like protein [Aspergillus ellipticus CBS 707.79]